LDHDNVSRRAKARIRTHDSNWLDAEEIEVVGSLDTDFANLSPNEQLEFKAAELEDLTIPQDFSTDELLGNIQWRVLESEEDWQSAIIRQDRDLSLKLTPEEYGLVHLQNNLILSGSAGTGKTTVGLYRLLQSLGSYRSGKRLYVAYNPLLVNNAQEQFQHLIKNNNTDIATLFEFKTIRDLCLEILQSFKQSYDLANEVNYQKFNQLYSRHPKNRTYPSSLVWDEIRSIIKGAQLSVSADILSQNDYERLGKKRSTVIPQNQRREVYKLAGWYQDKLKQDGTFDEIDLARKVLKNIQNSSYFRYQLIVCDEVQDFTELQLELLFQLTNSDGQLFFSGDLHQMISPSGFRWEDLKGKFYKAAKPLPIEKTLNFNFRSVSTLVNLANQVLRIRYRLLKETVKELSQSAKSYGEIGRLIEATPEKLKLILNELNPGEVILVRTDADKIKFCKDLQTTLVFTIEEAKGLEFDTVFLVEFFKPQQDIWKKTFQKKRVLEDKEKSLLLLELNLIYVAITRAKRILNIFESSIFSFWNEPELLGYVQPLEPELVRDARTEPTTENWHKQGLYYLKAELYQQAIECFEKSGNILDKQQSLVKLLLQQGNYNKAAEILVELDEQEKAAILFEKAQQWQQATLCWKQIHNTSKQQECSAKALEISGEWQQAAQLWEILNQPENANRCWIKSNNQQKIAEYKAIELEKQGHLSEAAISYEHAKMNEKAEKLRNQVHDADMNKNFGTDSFNNNQKLASFSLKVPFEPDDFGSYMPVLSNRELASEAMRLINTGFFNTAISMLINSGGDVVQTLKKHGIVLYMGTNINLEIIDAACALVTWKPFKVVNYAGEYRNSLNSLIEKIFSPLADRIQNYRIQQKEANKYPCLSLLCLIENIDDNTKCEFRRHFTAAQGGAQLIIPGFTNQTQEVSFGCPLDILGNPHNIPTIRGFE
jgi:superfamily I DNA/RNA helicase